jgi:hypothetical protein
LPTPEATNTKCELLLLSLSLLSNATLTLLLFHLLSLRPSSRADHAHFWRSSYGRGAWHIFLDFPRICARSIDVRVRVGVGVRVWPPSGLEVNQNRRAGGKGWVAEIARLE